ncbi:MAG: double-cubane-cluster-containing anaerobic reductase [Pseudomonadota bacterium]
MTTDYRPMWTNLGLDLDAHDALLNVLGALYTDTFLSQRRRPAGMGYFDFVMSEVHGLRIQELMDAKAEGRPVVGSFCVFVPEEVVLAANGVLVGLCAGAEFAVEEAEKYVPRNTCSLIKGAFGFALARVCPYLAAADMIVGENTCDGKKKSYELFAQLVNDLYVMDMPQVKSAQGRALLRAEYARFLARMEELAGRAISADDLQRGIRRVNAKRAALHRLDALRRARPAPISGLDALLCHQVSFYDDPERFTASVHAICDELEARIAVGEGVAPADAPRVIMSGCPMAVPNWKVPTLVERAGAVIVGEESCVGARGSQTLTDGSAATVDGLLDAIVERYLTIDCAVFTPNPSRLEHIRAMAADAEADGVMHYGLQFCHPYQIEAGPVERALEDGGVPTLRVDTDYSPEDAEQLRTRIEAFLERLQG